MAKTKIGGQAVFEGVMMRGESGAVAMAVRDTKGEILLHTERGASRKGIRKIPFLRGVINLIDSFRDGMGYLMRSAEVWGADDEGEEISKGQMKAVTVIGMFFGILLAVALFILLPDFVARILINAICGAVSGSNFGEVWSSLTSNALIESTAGMLLVGNLVKGLIKIGIFVLYLVLIAKMKEIKRVFMYHGAEHKTINCYESELPLTVENVQKSSAYHDRCGTAFIVFVILVSIVVMSFVEMLLTGLYASIDVNVLKTFVRVVIRIICLVPMAAISYELLMFNSKHDWFILKPLKAIGRGMQRLTTRPPEDSMAEVAITSFKAALAMDCNSELKTQSFITVGEYKEKAIAELKNAGIDDSAMVDWLICDLFNIKRSEIDNKRYMGVNTLKKADEMMGRLVKGEPLQYVLGNQQFFEYEFKVGKGVLVPRPETEELTERVIKNVTDKSCVLDLCTGSGCIGITVKLKSGAKVVCADKSEEALAYCRENADNLKADVDIVKSDMFDAIVGKFDIIVSNPPYIESLEIEKLSVGVKDYEPRMALDGGKDGLDYYRIITAKAKNYLNCGGRLLLETGEGQAQAVADMLKGWKVEIIKDAENKNRIIEAVLEGENV